jgi:hypothetical protein
MNPSRGILECDTAYFYFTLKIEEAWTSETLVSYLDLKHHRSVNLKTLLRRIQYSQSKRGLSTGQTFLLKCHCSVYRRQLMVPTLSQLNPIQFSQRISLRFTLLLYTNQHLVLPSDFFQTKFYRPMCFLFPQSVLLVPSVSP